MLTKIFISSFVILVFYALMVLISVGLPELVDPPLAKKIITPFRKLQSEFKKEYFNSKVQLGGSCTTNGGCNSSGYYCANISTPISYIDKTIESEPLPSELGYKCSCISNTCKWYKP